jgi:dTDP-4-dehydrorhamnose 3,5-epimerase
MSRFRIIDLPLPGLKRVERLIGGDVRGFLSRLFCNEELRVAGWHTPIAQVNHTLTTRKGTVRGMHFQHAPYAEIKLVNCLHGEIWDVALDLRIESPTYLCWHAERLSSSNHSALLIPAGFAHGFQALSDDVELLYCHSEPYTPGVEAGLNPLDPRLAIAWPLPVMALSAKDSSLPMINSDFQGVRL